MPIIQVHALPQPPAVAIPDVLRELTASLAAACGIPVEHVWATWHTIEPGHYVVGAAPVDAQPTARPAPPPRVQPPDSHDPIVHVLAFQGRPPDVIARALTALARVLTTCLGLAEGTAFITWTDLQPGCVYTGGAVRY
jgi:phenylpyruvate tautomerase PptA (4-oxalocrotonate tautomerase family)